MFCKNCGSHIDDNAKFCKECGHKVDDDNGSKLVSLKCDHCGAMLNVDKDSKELYCPYCGAKQIIVESDKVKIEKIKSKNRLDIINAHMANKDKENSLHNYKKSKLKIFSIMVAIICIIAMISSFKSMHYLAAIIALIQLCLLMVSWLIGMQILDVKIKNLYVALAALAFILIIPYFNASTMKVYKKIKWPSSGLVEVIPDPKAKYGKIMNNSDTNYYAEIDKVSEDKYLDYVNKCIEAGFNVDSEKSNHSYIAYNSDGYKLQISYYDNSYKIDLDAPTLYINFIWPNSPLVKLLPLPNSNMGKINYEYDDRFSIDVSNTSKEEYDAYVNKIMDAGFIYEYSKSEDYFSGDDQYSNHVTVSYEGFMVMNITIEKGEEVVLETSKPVVENNEEVVIGVDSDLKKFLDDYEAFIDDYIAFMTKYENSDNSIEMLSDYSNMMLKYASMEESLESYDEDNMSAVDLAYYLEVLNRCNMKMMNAAN